MSLPKDAPPTPDRPTSVILMAAAGVVVGVAVLLLSPVWSPDAGMRGLLWSGENKEGHEALRGITNEVERIDGFSTAGPLTTAEERRYADIAQCWVAAFAAEHPVDRDILLQLEGAAFGYLTARGLDDPAEQATDPQVEDRWAALDGFVEQAVTVLLDHPRAVAFREGLSDVATAGCP